MSTARIVRDSLNSNNASSNHPEKKPETLYKFNKVRRGKPNALASDPCERRNAFQNRTLAISGAEIAIEDAKSILPDFINSTDRERLIKKTDELQSRLTFVNTTILSDPRPSYNRTRDLLIELNDQSSYLNFLLCKDEDDYRYLSQFVWLNIKLDELHTKFKSELSSSVVQDLKILAINMSTLAIGHATTLANEYFKRISGILKYIADKCDIVECASAVNFSLNPPRELTTPWLEQQLGYTSKILNATLPINITEPLQSLQTTLDMKWDAYKWNPAKDTYLSYAIQGIVRQINNCNTMWCVNNVSLAPIQSTPYDDRDNVVFNDSDGEACLAGLLCSPESMQAVYALLIIFMLLVLYNYRYPETRRAITKKISDVIQSDALSKAIKSGTTMFAHLKEDEPCPDDTVGMEASLKL